MPRRSSLVFASLVLAMSASAQSPSPDLGPSVHLRLSSGEALANSSDDSWAVQYRSPSGWALGVLAQTDSYRSFRPSSYPQDGVIAHERDGVFREAGLIAEHTLPGDLLDIRLGAIATYRYRRDRSVGYTLREGGPIYHYPPVPDSVQTLQPDARFVSTSQDQSVGVALSATARRPIVSSARGWLAPGLGLAVATNHRFKTENPYGPYPTYSVLGFVSIPARVAVTQRVGVTLDGTIGAKYYDRGTLIPARSGTSRWYLAPAVSGSVSVDF